MTDLVVAGAGMAGLVASAEARRLGAAPVVFEKLDRPGGSMRLSSGVIWRHRELDRFRAECPRGDPELQRLLFERLDADLRWLESLGAPVAASGTGNPLTSGVRFDPGGLTDALVDAAGGPAGLRLASPLRELPGDAPVVLATGGFAADRRARARARDRRGRSPAPAGRARVDGRRPAPRAGRRRGAGAGPRARSTRARCRRPRRASSRATSCGSPSSTPGTRR